MNRRTKIIVSVVGILIVTLALIGLTYAYFLTRINGNSNDKSISVTTDKLELTYSDGNGIIAGTNIMPGTTLPDKTFSVTNNGSDTSYIVVLENVTVTDESNNATTFESNDFTYTLTCTSDCNGAENEVLPLSNGILVSNDIKKGATQEYTLTVTYKETGVDQSNDMGKTLNARVNISTMEKFNPYSSNKQSLAYNIINNAAIKKNGTELLASSKTGSSTYGTGKFGDIKISEVMDVYVANLFIADTADDLNPYGGKATHVDYNSCTSDFVGKYIGDERFSFSNPQITGCKDGEFMIYDEIKDHEKNLSIAPDDYGTSYYYRGNVKDNYVNFSEMCWRIVRIEGDGSIKLILEDRNAECDDNETSNTTAVYTGNWSDGKTVWFGNASEAKTGFINYIGGLADSLKSFQTSKLTGVLDKLKVDEWCYDDTVTIGDSYGYDDNFNQVYNESEATNGWIINKYYGAYTRIYTNKKPSLNCIGTKLTKYRDNTDMYVGALTADEMVYAGASGKKFYLINNYQKVNRLTFYSLSPSYHVNGYDFGAFFLENNLENNGELVNDDTAFNHNNKISRPSVTLVSNAMIAGGDGTQNNPYTIK